MTHAHNVLIRGLNSIYQQGAFVSDPQDVSDFLFYCLAWVKTVEHHHAAEEKTLFPELEKFTNNPDIMAENKHQHDAFLAGLTDFEYNTRDLPLERSKIETRRLHTRLDDASSRRDRDAVELEAIRQC
jgi:hypothetical protein